MKALNWAMGLILVGTMGQAMAEDGSPFGIIGGDGAPVIGDKNPFGGMGNDGSPLGIVGGGDAPVLGGGTMPVFGGGRLPGFGGLVIPPGLWGPIGGGDLPKPVPGKP